MQFISIYVIVYLSRDRQENDRKEVTTLSVKADFGHTFQDRRTKRLGKLLEYDEKFRTYLLESPDGKTFNITSSQFKLNWEEVADTVKEELVKPEVEKAKVSKKRYSGKSEEEKEQLNKVLETFFLVALDYSKQFEEIEILYIVPQIKKRRFLIKIRHHTIFVVDMLLRRSVIRVWMKEHQSDIMSWTAKPLCLKQYPDYYTTLPMAIEFTLNDLQTVLDDLKPLLLNELTEREVK